MNYYSTVSLNLKENLKEKNPAGQRATGLPDENYGNSYQQY
nr:hypothetical protein [uncultured Anaerobutyricum sp.]